MRVSKDTPINIVLPLAGRGSRFAEAGYEKPKPLIDVNGEPMIKRVIENIKPKQRDFNLTCICLKEHLCDELVDVLEGNIVVLNEMTEGAAQTVLSAQGFFDDVLPLVIPSCDQLVDIDIDDFYNHAIEKQATGCLMTFNGNSPAYSYCKTEENGYVTQTREKEVISNHANVGIYYFQNGTDFIDCARLMIDANIRSKNEFYLAPVYNFLIDYYEMFNVDNIYASHVLTYDIAPEKVHLIGTPEDLEKYLKANET